MIFGITQDVFKGFLAAKDELVVSKGSCKHPHAIFFQQTGMLKRTAGRTVKDSNIYFEIPGCA